MPVTDWRPELVKKTFDAAEYLDSPEMIAAYINEALEFRKTHLPSRVAIGTVAALRRGMSAVAEKAGLLARELVPRRSAGKRSRSSPPSSTVLHALGIDLVAAASGIEGGIRTELRAE